MILLDTDHTTFLKYPDSERGRRMIDRLDAVTVSEVNWRSQGRVGREMAPMISCLASKPTAGRSTGRPVTRGSGQSGRGAHAHQ